MPKDMRTKTITISLANPRKLFDSFSRHGGKEVLFVKTSRYFELCESVTVLISFPTENVSFRMLGEVISRRRGSLEPYLAAGIEVRLRADQMNSLQMALDYAEGKSVDFVQRSDHRLSCEYVIRYKSAKGLMCEFTEDISTGGTFIRTDTPLAVGTEIDCKLLPPGRLLGVRLKARVVWVKNRGPSKGMGVKFVFNSTQKREKVAKMLTKVMSIQSRKIKNRLQTFRKVVDDR